MPRETTRARWRCSRRPSGSTWATSCRTCGPSRHACADAGRAGRRTRSAGLGAPGRRGARRRGVVPAGVRARDARASAARPARSRRSRPALVDARRTARAALAAADDGGRSGTVIEVLALLALARHAAADGDWRRRVGTRAAPGRTGGLRPGLRRRGGRWPPCSRALDGADPTGPTCAGAGRLLEVRRGSRRQPDPSPRISSSTRSPDASGTCCGCSPATSTARHRPRARAVAQHGADPHQEHLRQARRHQPARRGRAGPPAQPARPHRPCRVSETTPRGVKFTSRSHHNDVIRAHHIGS